MVNPKDSQNLYNLTEQCRGVRENRVADGDVMSAATAVQQSQFLAHGDRCISSPFQGKQSQ